MVKRTRFGSFDFLLNEHRWAQLICGILLITVTQSAFAHGSVTYPPSRIFNCYQENPENPNSPPCIDAVASYGAQPLYDWMEINQGEANGNHLQFVRDGNLASGGRPEKYGGMDQVRSDWVATSVSPGPFTVTWTNTAPHATAYYRVYITNADWTPDQPLTWDNLTLLVQTPPSTAGGTVDIPVTLPSRTGKHVIYSIWQRSDSPEAFYSASDVDFGTGTTSVEHRENPLLNVALKQNYPNPFYPASTIGYTLHRSMFVTLKVYDVAGREVAILVNGLQTPGEHEAWFDGEGLSSGIYTYHLQAGDVVETKCMVLQR